MRRFPFPYRIANLVAGVLFVFAVFVQYNDPDPVAWMALYAAAAAMALMAFRQVPPPVLPGLVATAAFLWAARLLPDALGGTTLGDMFRTYEMMSPQMEIGRETLGLAIVGAWNLGLALSARRLRRPT